jgi:hypothetical protein
MVHPDPWRIPMKTWRLRHGEVGHIEGFVPTTTTAGRWLDLLHGAELLDRREAEQDHRFSLVRKIVHEPLTQAAEIVQGADADWVRRAGQRIAERIDRDIMGTVANPAVVGEARPLTIERLRDLQRQFNERYPAARSWQEQIINADYAALERRMAGLQAQHTERAETVGEPCNCPSCNPGPRPEPRETSQLRPIEDFLDGAEALIAESRERWLQRDHLPDAEQGVAPAPHASYNHEHDVAQDKLRRRLDGEEDTEGYGKDAEVLAPPPSFLPALKK